MVVFAECRGGTTPRRALVMWAGLHGTLQLKKLGRFGNQALVSAGVANDLGDDLLVAWGSSREALAGAKAELRRLVPHLAPPGLDAG